MNSSPDRPTHRRKLSKQHHEQDMPANAKEEKDRKGTAALKRPQPPIHSSSFSRRHASFNSPREVPLPSPSITQSMRQEQPDFTPVFGDDADWELIEAGSAKLQKAKAKDKQKSPPKSHTGLVAAAPPAAAPPPSTFSQPGKHKWEQRPQLQAGTSTGTILPYSRPYSLPETHPYQGRNLSKSEALDKTPGPSTVDRTSSASLPLPLQIPYSVLPRARAGPPSPVLERSAGEAQLRPPLPHGNGSSGSNSSGSLASAPTSRSPTPATPPLPASRGAAPMPPPELSTSRSGSVASYRPPRTSYTPVPQPPPDNGATAITRTPSLRGPQSFPPPEPPVILPTPPETPDDVRDPQQAEAPSRASSSSSRTRSSGASYEPFLSHAPPPVDSWIEVETTQAEYRLIVRLPGFKRDGITLATKKRRILHVVADSWEEGGGHFERRISFGYDADLAQVRAEFDGELLRVIIPRRMPTTIPAPLAPVGR